LGAGELLIVSMRVGGMMSNEGNLFARRIDVQRALRPTLNEHNRSTVTAETVHETGTHWLDLYAAVGPAIACRP
jgi:hypothetical protein